MTEAQVELQPLIHFVDIIIDHELSVVIYRDKIVIKPKKKGSRPIVLSIPQWVHMHAMYSRVESALDLLNC
jgi:hypothetical protein